MDTVLRLGDIGSTGSPVAGRMAVKKLVKGTQKILLMSRIAQEP